MAPSAESLRFRLENRRKTFRDNSAQKVFNVCMTVFSHMHTHTHAHSSFTQLYSSQYSLRSGSFTKTTVSDSFHSIRALLLSVLGGLGRAMLRCFLGQQRDCYCCFRFIPPLLWALLTADTSHSRISHLSCSSNCDLYQHIKKFYVLVYCLFVYCFMRFCVLRSV